MNIKDIIPKRHNKHDIMKNSFTSSTTNAEDYIYYPHLNDENSTNATNNKSSNDNLK